MLRGQFLATGDARGLRVIAFVLLSLASLCPQTHAQAPQPYLFVATSTNGQTGSFTFLRDDVSGPLTLLPDSSSTFAHSCFPTTIDPRGRFLYSGCGDGVAMYTLDGTTGALAEVPASPYAASRGLANILVVAESSGSFVYLIKLDTAGGPATNNFYLDTFQVDSATPALIPLASQRLNVAGTMVSHGVAADPNGHGLFLFLNQNLSSAAYPTAILYTITFDPVNGGATLDPGGGQPVGQNGRTAAMSPTGNFLALGYGATEGYFTVYQIAQNTFTLASLGNYDLGPEMTAAGLYDVPAAIFFNPGGNLMYVQAPPADFSGGGLPFLIFDAGTYLVLPSSPIPISEAAFVGLLADPQGPFAFAAASNGGVSVYAIDPVSGLSSQSGAIGAPFYPSLGNIAPVFAPSGPSGGQGSTGPVLSVSRFALSFPQTETGQTSTPQSLALKNVGNQTVSFTSIAVSGSNASDFLESDNCLNPPALSPGQTCAVSVSYAPAAPGASQASLLVTSNSQGSPQIIALSGTAIAPPAPAPQVTLRPTSVAFSGNTTQGTSSVPITLILTNSGNAALHIAGTALGGNNSPDFTLSNSTCAGTINAGANCSLALTFTPLASGIRTATLTFNDDAADSPQVVSITGTAVPAVQLGAATTGGNTTVSVTAGQTAQFNLQATPAAGFSGTLTLVCSGAPLGAACSVPSSVAVAGGSASTFTVTVTTSGSSALIPFAPAIPQMPFVGLRFNLTICAAIVLLLLAQKRPGRPFSARAFVRLMTVASLLFSLSLAGCGGGSSSSSPPPPVRLVTPSGTYTITVTPAATATGSTTPLSLTPIQLTLTVK